MMRKRSASIIMLERAEAGGDRLTIHLFMPSSYSTTENYTKLQEAYIAFVES